MIVSFRNRSRRISLNMFQTYSPLNLTATAYPTMLLCAMTKTQPNSVLCQPRQRVNISECMSASWNKVQPKDNWFLVRFRFHGVTVAANFEKAFLMIGVNEIDRDALLFMWVKNINDSQLLIEPLHFTRIMFGVRSSPFLLKSTIRHHLEQFPHPERHTLNYLRNWLNLSICM